MRINKTKNTLNNVLFGSINKIIAILFPFAIRTIIINVLGIQHVGLNSLFSSILNILSLAELGFGTAMVYSMYKPIAEDDTDTINALLNLYKKIYRIIGLVVLTAGLAIMPFLKYFIKGSYPADINLYILYSIFLANNVISYFFFAYKSSLLSAHQKNNITSKIHILTSTAMYVLQIVVLLCFKNYYIYIIFLPLSTLAVNILTAIITKKQYPQYFCKGTVSKEQKSAIKKQIYSLFLHRIGYVVQSSIDNICISAFLGLTLLGKYNNYYYIITAIQGFLTILKQSMVAGVGNSLIVDSKESNKKFFNKTLFIFAWIVGWCACCFMSLYQPFMNVWVKQHNMLPFSVVICLTTLFYINEIRGTVGVYKDALGMWYEDRFKPITISAVNLIGTIISAYFGWFEGIILSTAVAYLFVGLPWETYVFFKNYMNEKPTKYYLKQLFYLIVSIIAVVSTYFVCSLIPLVGVIEVVVKVAICMIVPNIIFVIAYFKTNEFKSLMSSLKKGKFMGKIKSILRKIYHTLPRRIKDPELRYNNKRYNVMLKLKKKYAKYISHDIVGSKEVPEYVFACWLQGEENAPVLVKKCFESMRKHFKDKKLIIITEENLKEYTNIPDFIYNKWKQGIIGNAHFSDILRTNLLVNHGGLWLDSTVLCTGNLDRYVDENTDLFVFKNEQRSCNSVCLSNWLIYAKKNNPVLVNMQNLLYKYWDKNNKAIEYYFYHMFFTIVTQELKEEWENIPFYTNIDPHVLWFYYFYKPYDEKGFKRVKEVSNFHKLSYKFDMKNVNDNSFYHYIIGEHNEKN